MSDQTKQIDRILNRWCKSQGQRGRMNRYFRASLVSLIRLAIEDEREECAKVADFLEFKDMSDDDESVYVNRMCRGHDIPIRGHDIPMAFHADRITAAIRKRGQS